MPVDKSATTLREQIEQLPRFGNQEDLWRCSMCGAESNSQLSIQCSHGSSKAKKIQRPSDYVKLADVLRVLDASHESRSPDGDGPSMKSDTSAHRVVRPTPVGTVPVVDSASRVAPRAGSEPADSHQVPASSGWQPIATAPKDGTKILLYGNGVWEVGGWHISNGWAVYYVNATHWMPLPYPPPEAAR